ncbi:MAG: response regulator [Endomicrobium sp.]|jgi:putative two-component system response regulator|nr:response regulator [Endomicrobium sp.]
MSAGKILIVDDIDINREILAEILQNDYEILQAKNGIEAFEKIIHNHESIDLILLDIMMPEMDGYEVLETLNKSGFIDRMPVIVITAMGANENEVKALQMGAADFITKPFFPTSILKRVELHLKLRNHTKNLEKIVDANIKKASEIRDGMVDFLANIIEYRDVESGMHIKRTRIASELLLQNIISAGVMKSELAGVDINNFSKAVAMHDIGKIAIPDKILLKPDKLTSEEFEIMKKHTTFGADMINKIEGIDDSSNKIYLETCRQICLYHHENWDGRGYPEGLQEYDIPIVARIMAVADVYDSLTSKRVYREALPHDESVKIMKELSGSKFDPIILDLFLANNEKFREIA